MTCPVLPEAAAQNDCDQPPPDVTIIDCGIGNIRSVQRMFEAADGTAEIATEPGELARARRVALPGVGAFDAGMSALTEGGWIEPLTEAVMVRRLPFIGICLGMQLLCRQSEEGQLLGLGWIEADVMRLERGGRKDLKLPHMGWSIVAPTRANPLIPSDEGEQRFYHVHKYSAVCDNPINIVATAEYGSRFNSAISRGNIYGVQFHPEKSHRFGLNLMRRFLDLPC